MSADNEITRTVAIEHAGETLHIEVHVHLTKEEIQRVVVPVVTDEMIKQIRNGVGGDIRLMPVRYVGKVAPSIACLPDLTDEDDV